MLGRSVLGWLFSLIACGAAHAQQPDATGSAAQLNEAQRDTAALLDSTGDPVRIVEMIKRELAAGPVLSLGSGPTASQWINQLIEIRGEGPCRASITVGERSAERNNMRDNLVLKGGFDRESRQDYLYAERGDSPTKIAIYGVVGGFGRSTHWDFADTGRRDRVFIYFNALNRHCTSPRGFTSERNVRPNQNQSGLTASQIHGFFSGFGDPITPLTEQNGAYRFAFSGAEFVLSSCRADERCDKLAILLIGEGRTPDPTLYEQLQGYALTQRLENFFGVNTDPESGLDYPVSFRIVGITNDTTSKDLRDLIYDTIRDGEVVFVI